MTKKPMTPKVTANKGLILFLVWPLASAGFAILVAGVAAMQKQCSAEPLTNIANGAGGVVGYLAPVSCGHFFQYTWWIAFLHFFVWALVFVYLVLNILHKTRVALVGMLAVAAVLLMDTANTYLYFDYASGLSSTMLNRTRITVAGAIIAAVADLLLILIIGYHDETTPIKERGEYGHNTYTGTGTTSAAYDTTGPAVERPHSTTIGTTGLTPNPPISGHV